MDYSFLDFLRLIGSVGLFLYGMKVMSEGLQKVAGDRLRNILSAMTRNRFAGMLTGVMITALIQSSSASTVMVVSFVNAGLMTLAQSMAVIMGANVGTTVTAWIIALFGFKINISLFALPLIGFSIPFLFSSHSKRKSFGEFLIGFSFLFMGLDFLNSSVPDLKANPEIFNFLQYYSSMGFGSVLIFLGVGAILTMVIQASSATFAITLIMCSKGWISFDIACALVLGSNIGTTITPILASLGGNVAAKRAALGHFMFNVLGTVWTLIVFMPFVNLNTWITEALGQGNPTALLPYINGVEASNPELYNQLNNGTLSMSDPNMAQFSHLQFSVSFGLSMFHMVFNIVNLSIMIWFTKLYVKIVTSVIPAKTKEDEEFQLKYISGGLLHASELNIAQAQKEIVVYAERIERMFEMDRELLHEKPNSETFTKLYSRIEKYEQIADRMEIEIATYLNQSSEGRLSYEGKLKIAAMLTIVTEIESIGDSCYNMARTLERKQEAGVEFTEAMVVNIENMFNYISESLDYMLYVLRNIETVKENDLIRSYNKEREINNYRNQLRAENVENINNKKYEYQCGIYYMDMIGESEKLGDYVINVCEGVKQQFKLSAIH